MTKNTYRLSDSTIAQIVQLIQMGILTGTDVSDQMRTLRVVTTELGTIAPDPDYLENFSKNLQRLEEEFKNEKST